MRRLELSSHLTDKELTAKLEAAQGKPEFSRWQILYMVQVARLHSADLIAPLVALSKPSIYAIVQQYNKQGVAAIKYTRRGGRRRSLLTEAEERELLDSIELKAARGLIKTAFDIKELVEKRVGKVVSDDYLWDLLKRNGWKKKMPRSHHPKRNSKEQDELKKNSPNVWQPPSGN